MPLLLMRALLLLGFTSMLDQVILYGDDQGVKRVCWEVIDWNTPAIEFYEHKGARVMRDWDVVLIGR